MMLIDMRSHPPIREQVHAGLTALRVQGRQIWGDSRHTLPEIAVRLMVGVGDLARLARDGVHTVAQDGRAAALFRTETDRAKAETSILELKKELGNIIFSTIRWIDDLGLDVLECLDLAIEAQEKFAHSGRQR